MGERAWEFGAYEDVGELAPLSEPRFQGVERVRKAGSRPGDAPPLILKSLEALRAHPTLIDVDLAWEVEVDDISAVAALPRLKRLSLGDVKGDLSPLAQCAQLTHLALQGDRLRTLAPLFPLAPHLESLSVTKSALSNLDGIERFTRLTQLSVSQTRVALVPTLPAGLRELDLGYLEDLQDVSAVAGCPGLEVLFLGYCPSLTNLQPLAGLRLVELELGGLTRLRDEDLTPLHTMSSLVNLGLGDTRVQSLEWLTGIPHLRVLMLYGCHQLHEGELRRVLPRLADLRQLNCEGDDVRTAALRHLLPLASVNNEDPLQPG